MKVNFVIGGTQKGGTWALQFYLEEHPGICMLHRHEPHFFDREINFKSRPVDYSGYHEHFGSCDEGLLLGDKTPTYMWIRSAPQRIREYNPYMKWIILLRNPIERAYSHWLMSQSKRQVDRDFWSALKTERRHAFWRPRLQHLRYSFVNRGLYADQLERIWRYFPRRQTLVLKSERLLSDYEKALREVYDFLELEPLIPAGSKSANVNSYPGPMRSHERDFLTRKFAPEIRRLERLLGWDLSDWT